MVFSAAMLLTINTYGQDKPTTAERESRRQVRAQKIEKSKAELKEVGQAVKEKAVVLGKAVGTEAEKAADAIDRKVEERKAKRRAGRDTL